MKLSGIDVAIKDDSNRQLFTSPHRVFFLLKEFYRFHLRSSPIFQTLLGLDGASRPTFHHRRAQRLKACCPDGSDGNLLGNSTGLGGSFRDQFGHIVRYFNVHGHNLHYTPSFPHLAKRFLDQKPNQEVICIYRIDTYRIRHSGNRSGSLPLPRCTMVSAVPTPSSPTPECHSPPNPHKYYNPNRVKHLW